VKNKDKGYGIMISLLVGLPIGLFVVVVMYMLPMWFTGEGIVTMIINGVYGKAIEALVLSFIIGLWIGGSNAFSDLSKSRSLLFSSFKYSITVNSIIWASFIIVTAMNNTEKGSMLFIIPPIIAFIICTVGTTFTLGLLICYIIKKRIGSKTIA